MEGLLRDLRHAARSLGRHRGLTIAAALSLGLAIGLSTTVFSSARAFLFDPLPAVEDPERVMLVAERPPSGSEGFDMAALATYLAWREGLESFKELSALDWRSVNVTGIAEPERVSGAAVTPNLLRMLGVAPALGRPFLEEDGREGADAVVLLGHGLWQRRFAGRRGVIGTTIELDGRAHTVIGVMPPDFIFPPGAQLWTPLAFDPTTAIEREQRYVQVFGRLRPGASREAARIELASVTRRLREAYPDSYAGWDAYIEPAEDYRARGPRPFILLLISAVAFVVLISCANVANLLLARGAARSRDIALRIALGAGRPRVIRQLLTEGATLGLFGGAIGSLLAVWGVALNAAAVPAEIRQYITGYSGLTMDTTALAFTLAVSLLAGLLSALAPALTASRPDLRRQLQEGSRGTVARRGSRRLRDGLVVVEVALALMLLVGAGLMVQSFVRLAFADIGFRPAGVLTMEISLPPARYADDREIADFYHELSERIRELSEVQAVGLTSVLPMSWSDQTTTIDVAGGPAREPGELPRAGYRVVTPGFFAALGIPLVQGRLFDERDDADAPTVAVLSRSAAQRIFGAANPVGRRVVLGRDGRSAEVVGLVGDARHNPLATNHPQAAVYVPLRQAPARDLSLVVRALSAPAGLTAAVSARITDLDPGLAPSDVLTMERIVSSALSPQRATVGTLIVLALVAAVLAAVGIYGVTSFAVARRVREMGIRVALGADRRRLIRLVVGNAMAQAAIGLALGLAGALALAGSLRGLLFGVSSTDPLTYLSVVVGLAAVAALAAWVPARRAAGVDPMVALRQE